MHAVRALSHLCATEGANFAASGDTLRPHSMKTARARESLAVPCVQLLEVLL